MTELSLEGCSIRDGGIESVTEGIERNISLRKLNLCNKHISNNGLKIFARKMAICKFFI